MWNVILRKTNFATGKCDKFFENIELNLVENWTNWIKCTLRVIEEFWLRLNYLVINCTAPNSRPIIKRPLRSLPIANDIIRCHYKMSWCMSNEAPAFVNQKLYLLSFHTFCILVQRWWSLNINGCHIRISITLKSMLGIVLWTPETEYPIILVKY